MGNSVKQWQKTYNISGKKRAAQKSIDAHHQARLKASGLHVMRKVILENEEEDEEEDPDTVTE